jgi:MFS family permease
LSAGVRRALHSLSVHNYRRYFAGQVISISGNWMQTVAEMWLVVQLTGSGVSVGLTAGLQFLPVLLLGAYGGVLADRHDKRRLLTITQTLMALPALALWVLTISGNVAVWMVYALVLVRGTVNAVDNPARQAFVSEIVGPERVVNAVSLNSVIVHTSRIVGPALAGGLIALLGVAPCFLVNALSFGAMIVALRAMDPAKLQPVRRSARARGQIRSAVAEVRRRPELRIPLQMMVVVGTLSFNFQVLLPLFADFTWHGTAASYALLTSAMGIGSVTGALAAGARNRVSPALLVGSSALFGLASLGAAAAPSLPLQALALMPLGAASVTFASGVNSSLQLAAGEGLRGRVMALYAVVFLGSTPIGAPLVGWLASTAGPRAGLVLGGAAALVAAAGALVAYARAGTPIAANNYAAQRIGGLPSLLHHGPLDRPRRAHRLQLRVVAPARPADDAAAPTTAAASAAPASACAAGRDHRGDDRRRGADVAGGRPAHGWRLG